MFVLLINLYVWIEENCYLLKLLVGNKMIDNGDFIVMVVGGLNLCIDYYYDEGFEWFYQFEGEMVLKVQEDGVVCDILICVGEIFLLLGKVLYLLCCLFGGIGLVVECKWLLYEMDGVIWYCECCNYKLYEEYFLLQNIEIDLFKVFVCYYVSLELCICSQCGYVDLLLVLVVG